MWGHNTNKFSVEEINRDWNTRTVTLRITTNGNSRDYSYQFPESVMQFDTYLMTFGHNRGRLLNKLKPFLIK